jgi:hypothetical protein
MRLGSQIVDFSGLDLSDNADQVGGIGLLAESDELKPSGGDLPNRHSARTDFSLQCARGKLERASQTLTLVNILVEVLDTPSVEAGRPANQAMHLIAFFQQKFRQVRAICSRRSSLAVLPRLGVPWPVIPAHSWSLQRNDVAKRLPVTRATLRLR